MIEGRVWTCKIGDAGTLPDGADLPMREAVYRAYKEITGEEPDFIFSGWGGKLTDTERSIVRGES